MRAFYQLITKSNRFSCHGIWSTGLLIQMFLVLVMFVYNFDTMRWQPVPSQVANGTYCKRTHSLTELVQKIFFILMVIGMYQN